MPRLSVWVIRAALLHLAAGVLIGAWVLGCLGWSGTAGCLRLVPLHIEHVLIGWLAQLPMGVAYWMLPRHPGGGRGWRWSSLLGFGLMNAGVLLSGLAGSGFIPTSMVVLGRSLEAVGVLGWLVTLLPRVKPFLDPTAARSPPQM